MVIRWLTVLSFLVLLTVQVSGAQEQAIEADNVVNSIGVDTHFAYPTRTIISITLKLSLQ